MLPRHVKRAVPGLVFTLAFAFIITACGSSSAQSGVTTINWWSWNPDATIVQPLLDSFNSTHSSIKLVYKNSSYNDYINNLKLAEASGTGPDIFGVQSGGMAKQYDQFMQDLSPYEQKADGANWADRYFSLGLSQFQNGSRTQALPFNIGAAGYIYYNKTYFDQYGLSAPKTLADWVSVSQTLKSKGITPFVQGAKDGWQDEDMFITFANSFAPGKIYDAIAGKVSFTDPDLVSAMDTWKALFSNGIVQSGALGETAYTDAVDKWVSGKAAMILLGTWNADAMSHSRLSSYQSQLGFTQNYEYLPVLVPQVGSHLTQLFGGPDVGLAINKSSAHKDAAWQVIQFLESPTGGQAWVAKNLNDFPAVKGVTFPSGLVFTDAQQAALQQMQTDLNNAIGYRNVPYPALDTALIAALQNVASGQQTSQQALETLQQTSQSIQR